MAYFQFSMKRNNELFPLVGRSKRKTRSNPDVGSEGQVDMHSIGEYAKGLPQIAMLNSLDGLDREVPALIRQFVAVEYKDKEKRVSVNVRASCVL